MDHVISRQLSRRSFLKAGAGAVVLAAGAASITRQGSQSAQGATGVDLHLAATDGWIALPVGSNDAYTPDPYAPTPLTTFGFGFRDVTGLTSTQIRNQKNKTQGSAPMFWATQEQEVRVKLTNLGMGQRPDLTDGHTIHWHGFRNAIPLFDGVPELSIGVPIGRDFTYFYKPHEPGTYMYHCHFEDVEHVSMGMTGIVFVRPAMGPKFVYNDASTAFDREFGMFLSELWTAERWRGAHIQEHDWSDYEANAWLLNGRGYPDTLAPNGPGRDPVSGDLIEPAAPYQHLKYQPISSLVTANSGDKVLLRFVNLGYEQQAMTVDGIALRVVGKDATLMKGRDGTSTAYSTNTIYIGPGESVDAIFVAPNVSSERTYRLYNRNLNRLHNPGMSGLGGQLTEIHIRPAGSYAAQVLPNT